MSCKSRANRWVDSTLAVKTTIIPFSWRWRSWRILAHRTTGFCSAVQTTVNSSNFGGTENFSLWPFPESWFTSKNLGFIRPKEASFCGSRVIVADTKNLRSCTGRRTESAKLLPEDDRFSRRELPRIGSKGTWWRRSGPVRSLIEDFASFTPAALVTRSTQFWYLSERRRSASSTTRNLRYFSEKPGVSSRCIINLPGVQTKISTAWSILFCDIWMSLIPPCTARAKSRLLLSSINFWFNERISEASLSIVKDSCSAAKSDWPTANPAFRSEFST